MKLLSTLALLVACTHAHVRAPVHTAPFAAATDRLLGAYHARGDFDGVVAIRKHGELVYLAAFGAADREAQRALTVGDVFPLASLTKQVTAVLVMQEVAAHHLALTDQVQQYVPDLISVPITVKQLLQHTSGMPDPEAGVADNAVSPFYQHRVVGDARAEARRCTQGTFDPPGSFRYNNCDYIVLGALLEHLTGRTFAQLVQERVIAKLGLTSWGVAAEHPPITIRSYRSDGSRSPEVELAAFGAAAAIYGDAHDLSTFSQALLDHTLLDAAATTIMTTGDPQLGMEGLGSWGYELPVPGRPKPVSLVERQGGMYGTRILALASPSDDFTIAILATTERTDLFNLWTRKGLPFELVSLVAK
ncbi:serine hydrolase domain-containing protein [soil metagenome]